MSSSKKAPQRPFEVGDIVRIRVGCRDYNLYRLETGLVVEVMKGVSRPIVVRFRGIRDRYQPGDLERV